MNSITILFEKVSLERQRFIFKPMKIVKGVWDQEEHTFLTIDGDYYDLLDGGDPCDDYFCDAQTTMQELKKIFGSDNTEDELLNEYYNLCTDYLYTGYYDENTNGLSIKRISFEQIIKSIGQGKQDKDLTVGGKCYTFDKQALEDIRNLPESEIKNKIDEIIDELDKEDDVKEYPNIIPSSRNSQKLMTLKKLRREVLSKIVGQDDAVNDITRGIMINQTSTNPNNKSHMLVTGPTGTGKTEIVKIVCESLNLPFFEADATAYTKEGYVGKSVYSMLEGLIQAADGDIEAAQNGILVIDEIDKKVYGRAADDVGGKDVLYSLLKIMDRGNIELNNKFFDTSNLTIICMSAFEEFYQKKLKANNKIGFSDPPKDQRENIILSKGDLVKEGVPAEFLGRIGDVTSTIPFDEKTLIYLLYKSKLSALKLQKEYFKDAFGVDLINTYGYVKEIANQALKSKTNARELKPLIRTSLKYATDEFLSGRKAKVLKLSKATALDSKKYYIE